MPAFSIAVQDYAKAIYALEERDGEVTTTSLAARMHVTPASASAMIRKLAEQGLVTHTPYKRVELTDGGRTLALEMVRHHRLLETYLAVSLDMPWDRVHAEAEVLEHVISEELEARIAAKLGHPTHDPHGDPIPSADLSSPRTTRARWTACSRAITARWLASPTTPTCSATCPSAASRPARSSGSSTSSRSAARCSCTSAPRRTAAARRLDALRAARRPEPRRRRGATRRAQPAGDALKGRVALLGSAPSSPPSRTSTPATSPPTSRAAPSTATCSCG